MAVFNYYKGGPDVYIPLKAYLESRKKHNENMAVWAEKEMKKNEERVEELKLSKRNYEELTRHYFHCLILVERAKIEYDKQKTNNNQKEEVENANIN